MFSKKIFFHISYRKTLTFENGSNEIYIKLIKNSIFDSKNKIFNEYVLQINPSRKNTVTKIKMKNEKLFTQLTYFVFHAISKKNVRSKISLTLIMNEF